MISKPSYGVRFLHNKPLARDLIVAVPMLEGSGIVTKEYVNNYHYQYTDNSVTSEVVDPWVATPYGLAMDFSKMTYAMATAESPWCRLSVIPPRPVFAEAPALTVIGFGQLAASNLARAIFDITSSNNGSGGDPWKFFGMVEKDVIGRQMSAWIGDTKAYSSIVLTKPGVWANFVYRLVPGEFIDFMYLPVKDDAPQKQRVATALSPETSGLPITTYRLNQLGNNHFANNSWNNPLIYVYAWRRYVTDSEIESLIASPYQFFR